MRLFLIVAIQILPHLFLELFHRREITTPQKLPTEHAEPQFYLIQPRAVQRYIMKYMLVLWITQKGASLGLVLQLFRLEGNAVQVGHDFAQIQAPMRVQIVHDPVDLLEPLDLEVLCHPQDMGAKIEAGSGLAQIPNHLSRRHCERSHQSTCAQSRVFEFAFFRLAHLYQLRRRVALEDLHTGFFIAADHQSPLLVERGRVDIQLTNLSRLGFKVGIVTVEPIDAFVRFEIGIIENPPDGGAVNFLSIAFVDDGGSNLIQGPACGGLIVIFGFAGGDTENVKLL